MTQTLLVSLFAGPGTGKSTTAAQVFGTLKQRGYNVELVHEFAKDLTWEERHTALAHQPYIVAKQMYWIDRLEGKVEAVIADTSTLYGLIYPSPYRTPAFDAWLRDDYQRRRTLNVFIERDPERAYNVRGRSQSPTEATKLDKRIRAMLEAEQLDWYNVRMDKRTNLHVEEIAGYVESELDA